MSKKSTISKGYRAHNFIYTAFWKWQNHREGGDCSMRGPFDRAVLSLTVMADKRSKMEKMHIYTCKWVHIKLAKFEWFW